MQGLKMTRKYKQWTFLFRKVSRVISQYTLDPLEKLALATGILKKPQKTLLWEKQPADTKNFETTQHPAIRPSTPPSRTPRTPSIEPSDYSAEMVRDNSQQGHDTPNFGHTLFPPAIPMHRPRNDMETSAIQSPPLSPHRPSNDRHCPLPPERLTGTYHYGERSGSAVSGDDRHSSGEDTISAASPPQEQSLSNPLLGKGSSLQPRQGYTGAKSDPRSAPTEDGLGIRFDVRDLEAGVT
jgi:hypothetical protein